MKQSDKTVKIKVSDFPPEEPVVEAINDVIGGKGVCYVCGKEAIIGSIDFTFNGIRTRGNCCYGAKRT